MKSLDYRWGQVGGGGQVGIPPPVVTGNNRPHPYRPAGMTTPAGNMRKKYSLLSHKTSLIFILKAKPPAEIFFAVLHRGAFHLCRLTDSYHGFR